MSAVAERLVVGCLAAADVEDASVIDRELERDETRPLVRAIAERLRFRASASAVPVFLTFRQFDLERTCLSDNRLIRHR